MSRSDKPSPSSRLLRPAGIFVAIAALAGAVAAWMGLRGDSPAGADQASANASRGASVQPALANVAASGNEDNAGGSVEAGATASRVKSVFAQKKQELLRNPAIWLEQREKFYEAWGEADGAAAAEDAAGTNPGASTRCCEAVLAGWLRKAPEAARSWIDSHPDGAEKALLSRAIVRAADEKDLKETAAWVAAEATGPRPNPGSRATISMRRPVSTAPSPIRCNA